MYNIIFKIEKIRKEVRELNQIILNEMIRNPNKMAEIVSRSFIVYMDGVFKNLNKLEELFKNKEKKEDELE